MAEIYTIYIPSLTKHTMSGIFSIIPNITEYTAAEQVDRLGLHIHDV